MCQIRKPTLDSDSTLVSRVRESARNFVGLVLGIDQRFFYLLDAESAQAQRDRHIIRRVIGVAHLGTREYYDAIQKRLDSQSAVLYEGVGGDKMASGAKPEAGIQTQLANALGLMFQLDAIDYKLLKDDGQLS